MSGGDALDPAARARLSAAAGWPGTIAVSVALVGYGNLSTLATWAPWPWPLVPLLGHPLLLVGAPLWGRGPARLSWQALGLGRGGWRRGVPLGLVLAALMSGIVGVLILLFRAIDWTSTTTYAAHGAVRGGVVSRPAASLLGAVAGAVARRAGGGGAVRALAPRGVGMDLDAR